MRNFFVCVFVVVFVVLGFVFCLVVVLGCVWFGFRMFLYVVYW